MTFLDREKIRKREKGKEKLGGISGQGERKIRKRGKNGKAKLYGISRLSEKKKEKREISKRKLDSISRPGKKEGKEEKKLH